MNRTKAAFSHLLLSVVIFSVIVVVLLTIWYPAPYFSASGGWQGLKIAAGVDLVLGPLLMLVVFDKTKTQIKLIGDIVIIVAIQLSALTWGVSTIYGQRPIAVVFWENSFYSIPASAMKGQKIELKYYGATNPVFIYAEKPQTIEGLTTMLQIVEDKRIAPHHQIGLYHSLIEKYQKITPFQVDIKEIVEKNKTMNASLLKILAKANKNIDDFHYYKLQSKYKNIILLFDHSGVMQNYIIVPKAKTI